MLLPAGLVIHQVLGEAALTLGKTGPEPVLLEVKLLMVHLRQVRNLPVLALQMAQVLVVLQMREVARPQQAVLHLTLTKSGRHGVTVGPHGMLHPGGQRGPTGKP